MSEPGIEKKKGTRRRSARTYVPIGKVPPDELERELEIVARYFPPDDDDDQPAPAHSRARAEVGKRDVGTAERRELASEGRALPNLSYPVKTRQDAENALAHIRLGHGDVKEAKRMLRRVAREEGWSDILDALGGKKDGAARKAAAGNPADMYGNLTDRRVSPPLTAGHQSPSPGDHGAWADPMNVPGPRALALGHPSMRQGTTSAFPMSMMQTFNGDNQFGDRDITLGGGRVSLQRLDAAAATGLDSAPGNPVGRRMDHTAPIGRDNGGHSLSQPESRHPMSMKNSDRVEIMRRFMFPSGGRG